MGEAINDFQFDLVNPSAGEQGLPVFLTFTSTDYSKPVNRRIKEMSEALLVFPGAGITGQESALQEAQILAVSMNDILDLVGEYLNLESMELMVKKMRSAALSKEFLLASDDEKIELLERISDEYLDKALKIRAMTQLEEFFLGKRF